MGMKAKRESVDSYIKDTEETLRATRMMLVGLEEDGAPEEACEANYELQLKLEASLDAMDDLYKVLK